MKPFSESCERNKQPILVVLKPLLSDKRCLLEVGSGTGQHAVFFAEQFAELIWQTSDRVENHPGIQQWLDESANPNLRSPIPLDVIDDRWPDNHFDAVYSANTAHIMSWRAVMAFFEGVGTVLQPNGLFILYGPFNYGGKFTSESNRNFEGWLKNADPERGIRDFEAVNQLAEQAGMSLLEDYPMPSNNRILVWQKN